MSPLAAAVVLAGAADALVRVQPVLEDGVAAASRQTAVTNLTRKSKGRQYLPHPCASVGVRWRLQDHRTLVFPRAYSGLRWGEVTGPRRRHLNLLRRWLSVDENAAAVGGRIVPGTPKSHDPRGIPLPRSRAPRLEEQCEGRGPDDLVFSRQDGRHLLRPETERSWCARAIRETGVADAPTPHALRHTAASLAIQAEANIRALRHMLGHASASLTLDRWEPVSEQSGSSRGWTRAVVARFRMWAKCGHGRWLRQEEALAIRLYLRIARARCEWAQRDSNPRPPRCKRGALTN